MTAPDRNQHTEAHNGTGTVPPKTVRVVLNTPRKGRREGFHRLVKEVDPTKRSAYAFIGDRLESGYELDLPVGAIIVRRTPDGSNQHPQDTFQYTKVLPEGEAWQWSEPRTKRTFLTFRDEVAQALAEGRDDMEEDTGSGENGPGQPRRPAEMTPESLPPVTGRILNASQMYGHLDHILAEPGKIAFDQASQTFIPDGGPETDPRDENIIADINVFLRNVGLRCPRYLAGRMGFDGAHITLRASQQDMFKAIHGVDLDQARELLQNAYDPENTANPKALTALQKAVDSAQTETGRFREETWRTVAQNLEGLGLKLGSTPLPDTKKLCPWGE